MRVSAQRREIGAVRYLEAQAGERNIRVQRMDLWKRGKSVKMLCEIDKCLLKFASEQAADSLRAKNLSGKRSVESVSAEVSVRIHSPHRLEQFHGQARCRMHRHVERDQTRFPQRLFVKRLARKVHASNCMAPLAQPRRRRSQPKRLPPQLIR